MLRSARNFASLLRHGDTKGIAVRALRRLGVMPHVNFNMTIERNGASLLVPVVGGVGAEHLERSEPWMDHVLEFTLTQKPGVFIDVGVNTGQTLLTVASIGREMRYIGFEPNPMCFEYAMQLIELNNLRTFKLVPFALSDRLGTASLHLNSMRDSGATIVDNFRDEQTRLTCAVAMATGDEFLAQQTADRPVSTLKIDVEGAELEVIKGLLATIRADLPFIVVEILPTYGAESALSARRRGRQDELLALTTALGYVLFRVHGDSHVEELNDIADHSSLDLTNYLLAPASYADRLRAVAFRGSSLATREKPQPFGLHHQIKPLQPG